MPYYDATLRCFLSITLRIVTSLRMDGDEGDFGRFLFLNEVFTRMFSGAIVAHCGDGGCIVFPLYYKTLYYKTQVTPQGRRDNVLRLFLLFMVLL
jgi:hypothetical protein